MTGLRKPPMLKYQKLLSDDFANRRGHRGREPVQGVGGACEVNRRTAKGSKNGSLGETKA